MKKELHRFALPAFVLLCGLPATAASPAVDRSGYSSDSGTHLAEEEGGLQLAWPLAGGGFGRLSLDLRSDRPLIAALGIADRPAGPFDPILSGLDPVFALTAGIRNGTRGRPPAMSIFNEFFDNPASRPHQTHPLRLDLKEVRVVSAGRRTTVHLGEAALGPYRGELLFTVYSGSRLVHLEAAVTTAEDRRAFFYSAGLLGGDPPPARMSWMDTEGRLQELPVDRGSYPELRNLAVRHRTILAAGERGTVACFPPPHQFFFPRDLTDNLKYLWLGRAPASGGQGPPAGFGFGVRQSADGGGNFVPWFNSPPGTRQRLGVFFLLTAGGPQKALEEVLRYTRGDRFTPLPGHLTFTSHWHMAIAVAAMQDRKKGLVREPELVKIFRDLGVNAVHLAEFHGDGHQHDPGPLRLPELEAMFEECRRLSAPDLLFIPGEEVNDYLGIREEGKHPGHWMSLFPRPVRWAMRRAEGQPFAEPLPGGGTFYRVGSRADMVELLKKEGGLAWSAHPRIKASSWTPDIFRREDFYLDDRWLGAAWKAMPADLSRERLGERCLDLLDDMANWGQQKYLVGEVDVFKIDHSHELYGHMNINYLRLDRLPAYDAGWQPILDALRAGKFFVTTGEVLIEKFTLGGKESGESLTLPADGRPEAAVDLSFTFPLNFLEIISGDGEKVYRDRTDLRDTEAFGKRVLALRPDLRGRKWARLEVWDAAANGAFSQPVWLRAE